MPAFTLARGWSQPKPPSMADRLWCCVTVGHDTAVETKQPSSQSHSQPQGESQRTGSSGNDRRVSTV